MKESEARLASPCGKDFRAMAPAAGGRLCDTCAVVVRDLSSMREADARTLLATAGNGQLCVRYLYDANGEIAFADGRDVSQAAIVPAFRLSRRARAQAAALLSASLVLFEACGGGPGNDPVQNWQGTRDPATPETGSTVDAGTSDAMSTEAAAPTDDAGTTDAGSDAATSD